jgi:hypothetical protein
MSQPERGCLCFLYSGQTYASCHLNKGPDSNESSAGGQILGSSRTGKDLACNRLLQGLIAREGGL